MNIEEQVKQCRTPQEALLVLARAIDELAAKPVAGIDLWAAEVQLDWTATPEAKAAFPYTFGDAATNDNRSQIIDGDVVVKPVSKERQQDRAAFAVDSRLYEFYGSSLSLKDFHDAYVKGGPRWLYYTNREAVMQMPESYRRALVADVLLDSPSEADEIGRDILKYDESVPEGAALEAYRRDLGPAYKGRDA